MQTVRLSAPTSGTSPLALLAAPLHMAVYAAPPLHSPIHPRDTSRVRAWSPTLYCSRADGCSQSWATPSSPAAFSPPCPFGDPFEPFVRARLFSWIFRVID
jgi:hypothetical protein